MNSRANSKPVIFVVDDESLLLDLAATILGPAGYEVKTFEDPGRALEAFKAAQPRPILLITDYAMHRMNGMELIRECKRAEPGQKIILISGTVDESVYRDSPVKPDRFIGKPYHSKQLIDLVAEVLAT